MEQENSSVAYLKTSKSVTAAGDDSQQPDGKDANTWVCDRCTLINPSQKICCMACLSHRPGLDFSFCGGNANAATAPPQTNLSYCTTDQISNRSLLTMPDPPSLRPSDGLGNQPGAYRMSSGCVGRFVNSDHALDDYTVETYCTGTADNNNRDDMIDAKCVAGDLDDEYNDCEWELDHIPEAKLPFEEDPFHKKLRRRMRRKHRMMAFGAAGIVTGAVLGGPATIVACGAAGAVGARVVSKRKERLKDDRLDKERASLKVATPIDNSVGVTKC